MGLLEMFEQIALNAHYKIDVGQLINNFPDQIQTAILLSDGERLKELVSGSAYLANESHVVQALQ